MLSGEYDATYPLETSARPFFDFLGTNEANKKHCVSPGGHAISRIDLTRETLDWFDRYLGEVRLGPLAGLSTSRKSQPRRSRTSFRSTVGFSRLVSAARIGFSER